MITKEEKLLNGTALDKHDFSMAFTGDDVATTKRLREAGRSGRLLNAVSASVMVAANASLHFLERLHFDLLQRPMNHNEQRFYQLLLSGGAARAMVARILLSRQEYRMEFVQSRCQILLGRRACATDLYALANALGFGATETQVITQIVASHSYFAAAGGSHQSFLERLFLDLIGREMELAERKYFEQALEAGSSRDEVALSLIDSDEYRRKLVTDCYWQFLDRLPTSDELNAGASALKAGAAREKIILSLVSSEEYFEQAARGASGRDTLEV